MILVTGAAGKTGRAVIRHLIAEGQQVRGLLHRPEQEDLLRELGVCETVVGDILDLSTINQAVHRVTAVYHICPNMHPEETSIGSAIIRAAEAAGVERFVYHSVLHPQTEEMMHHWQKMRVEEELFKSGLSYTILQPAAYMQNVLTNWDQVKKQGVYVVPYSLETRLNMVDLMDVAEVATIVLLDSSHKGATYELCGAEFLSQSEIVGILGRESGRTIRGETISVEKWREQAQSTGLNDYAVTTLGKMFQYYERYGFQGNANVLTWLLGRPPTTFTGFLKRTL